MIAALIVCRLFTTYQCVTFHELYIGQAIPNVVTDVVLLVLPLPYVWRLQLPAVQKGLVSVAFIMGCL